MASSSQTLPAAGGLPTEDGDVPEDGPDKRDLIAGLEKGLAVIEAFHQEPPRLSITEVAERTGLTRAAARRSAAR